MKKYFVVIVLFLLSAAFSGLVLQANQNSLRMLTAQNVEALSNGDLWNKIISRLTGQYDGQKGLPVECTFKKTFKFGTATDIVIDGKTYHFEPGVERSIDVKGVEVVCVSTSENLTCVKQSCQ